MVYYKDKRGKKAGRMFRRILAVCCMLGLAVPFPAVTVNAALPGTMPLQAEAVSSAAMDDEELAAYARQLNEELARMLEYQQSLIGQNMPQALLDQAQQSVQILRQKQAEVMAQMALRQQPSQSAIQKPEAEAAAQSVLQQTAQAAQAAAQQAAQRQAAEAAGKAAAQQQALQPSNGQLIAAGLLNNAPDSFFKGKSLSILGDSISTYQGYIPGGYACYYPDADNNLKDVTQTWWMQVLYNTGMRLAVNGSYSASAVCGDSRGENSSAGCSSRRLSDLIAPDGTVPDVILVYMGTNDFLFSIPLGKFSGTPTYRTDHYIWDFTEGYELMLQKLQAIYPSSRIYCMTLLEQGSPKVNENGNTIADYNRRIKEVAAAHGVPVIDLQGCGGVYTSDGTHPNKDGAAKMAAYVTNTLFMGG